MSSRKKHAVTPTQRPVIPTLGPRERAFASVIWQRGRISRREIHQLTDTHPTLTGTAVSALIESGLIREGELGPAAGRGRPQVPLEVDPDRRTFVGLAIAPGAVDVARLSPTGELVGAHTSHAVTKRQNPVAVAAELLAGAIEASTIAVGVSVTGLALPREHRLLFSSSLPAAASVSMEPIYEAAGAVPVLSNNDMNALALRWLLTNGMPAGDALLVGVDDGRLGASLLLGGRPRDGSMIAANELGHTRLAVDTEPCYCGQSGCLERIVSTAQLKRLGAKSDRSLADVLTDPRGDRRALAALLDLFVMGLGNAVNFARPERLVITSPLAALDAFTGFVRERLPAHILPGLRERVELSFWEQDSVQSAENAAWLALADVFGRPPAAKESDVTG